MYQHQGRVGNLDWIPCCWGSNHSLSDYPRMEMLSATYSVLSYTDNYLWCDTNRTGISWLLIMAELQGLSTNELITKSSSITHVVAGKGQTQQYRNNESYCQCAIWCHFQRCCEHHDCVLFNRFGSWEDLGNTKKQTSKYQKNSHSAKRCIYLT